MRCLRHTTAAFVLRSALGAPSTQAGDLAAGINVANAGSPGVPQRCGNVKIDYSILTPPNDTSGAIAEAHVAECSVRIKPGIAEAFNNGVSRAQYAGWNRTR